MNASTDSVPKANASDSKEDVTQESAEAAVESANTQEPAPVSSTAPEPATQEPVCASKSANSLRRQYRAPFFSGSALIWRN